LSLEHRASEFERVTVSIGAAVGGPTSEILEPQLFEAADRALYKAKREGRNRLEFAEVEKSMADAIDDGALEGLHSPNRADGGSMAEGKD